MNLPCEVIQDLLPLYAEGLTGQESNRLIAAHLESCPDCESRLRELKKPAESAAPEDVRAIRTLKQDLKKRRRRTAALAGLVVFLLAFFLFVQDTGRTYIPYEEGIFDCEKVGDELVVRFHVHVTGTAARVETDPEGGRVLYLEAWQNRLDLLNHWGSDHFDKRFYDLGTGGELHQSGAGEITAVYYTWEPRWPSEENAVLIYGEPVADGLMVLPRLVLGYYALLALALAVMFALLLLLLRRKKAAGTLRQLLFAPLSWLAGHVLVKGFGAMSFDAGRDFLLILSAATAFYALLTLGYAAARQRRLDRA